MTKKLTPDQLRDLRADIDKALAPLILRHGLARLAAGSASYDGDAGFFTFRLEGLAAGGLSKDALRYEELRSYTQGLPPLGTTLKYSNRLFVINGSNATGSKVKATCGDGKLYLLPVGATVAAYLRQGGAP